MCRKMSRCHEFFKESIQFVLTLCVDIKKKFLVCRIVIEQKHAQVKIACLIFSELYNTGVPKICNFNILYDL